MGILIDNRQNQHRISLENVRKAAQGILNDLAFPDAELSILLVDDAEIEKLNRRYLHREGPTNVIAFPMQEGAFANISPQLLGDVVVSMDTAVREARGMEIHPDRRLLELLIHGILHLRGYDHETSEAQARKMDVRSRELLDRVGSLDIGPLTTGD